MTNIYELASELYESSEKKDDISFDAFIYNFMKTEEIIELFHKSISKDESSERKDCKVVYVVDHEKREIRAFYCLNKEV